MASQTPDAFFCATAWVGSFRSGPSDGNFASFETSRLALMMSVSGATPEMADGQSDAIDLQRTSALVHERAANVHEEKAREEILISTTRDGLTKNTFG